MRTPDGHLFFLSFAKNPQTLERNGALGEIRTHNLLIRRTNFLKIYNYLKITVTIKSRLCRFFIVGDYSDLLPKFMAKFPTSVPWKFISNQKFSAIGRELF
jgi:hypothetical protein